MQEECEEVKNKSHRSPTWRGYTLCDMHDLDPFWVNCCVWCEEEIQMHSSTCGYPFFFFVSALFVVLSPLNCLNTFVDHKCRRLVLISIPLIYLSVIILVVPHCSFGKSFEIRTCESSNSVILFQDCFGYSECWPFSLKKPAWFW